VEVNREQPNRPDIDVAIFEGVLYQIIVETVTQDRNGVALRPEFHYSIVREIHFLAAPPTQTTRTTHATQTTQQPSNPLTFQPSNPYNPLNLVTHQHSNTDNTPPASSTLKKSARGKSLGSNHQQHNYPEGGVEKTISASPSKEPVTIEANLFPEPPKNQREILKQQARTVLSQREGGPTGRLQ
jgi:hypothetical protein